MKQKNEAEFSDAFALNSYETEMLDCGDPLLPASHGSSAGCEATAGGEIDLVRDLYDAGTTITSP